MRSAYQADATNANHVSLSRGLPSITPRAKVPPLTFVNAENEPNQQLLGTRGDKLLGTRGDLDRRLVMEPVATIQTPPWRQALCQRPAR